MMAEALSKGSLARNVLLYGAIGLVASGTDTAAFTALTYLAGFPALVANAVSVPVGISISFTLNRKYNFKVADHAFRRGAIFFSVGGVGFALSQLIVWAGSSLGCEPIAVKLGSVVVVAAVQFTLNKLVSFGVDFGD